MDFPHMLIKYTQPPQENAQYNMCKSKSYFSFF